jgi:hypothetical protein
MSSNLRRHRRAPFKTTARVFWQDKWGQPKFAMARTLDVSERGLSLELPERLEVRGFVGVECERLGLRVMGTVRHSRRIGSKYLVGLEFGGTTRINRAAIETIERLLPVPNRDHTGRLPP